MEGVQACGIGRHGGSARDGALFPHPTPQFVFCAQQVGEEREGGGVAHQLGDCGLPGGGDQGVRDVCVKGLELTLVVGDVAGEGAGGSWSQRTTGVSEPLSAPLVRLPFLSSLR